MLEFRTVPSALHPGGATPNLILFGPDDVIGVERARPLAAGRDLLGDTPYSNFDLEVTPSGETCATTCSEARIDLGRAGGQLTSDERS